MEGKFKRRERRGAEHSSKLSARRGRHTTKADLSHHILTAYEFRAEHGQLATCGADLQAFVTLVQ